MANIIGAIVPVGQPSAEASLADVPLDIVDGLVPGALSRDRISVRWHTAPTAPISQARLGDGSW